jgi:hypothetical protein
MEIRDAQRDMRRVFLGGFAGALVAGALWLESAALATWCSKQWGVMALILGGVFIFPATLLVLRLMGRKTALAPGNPLAALAMQVAFTVPIAIPVILAATAHRSGWFYPAFMVIVGAHYLPFIFLYGMWQYGMLAALMIVGGLAIGWLAPGSFALGGWVTGVMFLAFAFVARAAAREDQATARAIVGGLDQRTVSVR